MGTRATAGRRARRDPVLTAMIVVLAVLQGVLLAALAIYAASVGFAALLAAWL